LTTSDKVWRVVEATTSLLVFKIYKRGFERTWSVTLSNYGTIYGLLTVFPFSTKLVVRMENMVHDLK
jgi:hypothetical protein